jgi:Leucine-rich repeat (LRR) protein
MKKSIILLFLLFVIPGIKAQEGPISAAELAKYPTYRKITRIPIDSAYKVTVENLGEIPKDIDRLKHLQRFTIFGNDWDYDLYTIPSSLYDLPNLTYLSIANTDINTIGSGIKNCKYLSTLSVANNKLLTLPNSLGELEDLQELVIDNNIREIPEIPSLEDLSIYFQTNMGDDSGTIPIGINKQNSCHILRIYSEDTKINIPEMMSIIFDMQAIEKLTFIDPNITADEISRLSQLRNIKELNLPSIQTPPDVFKDYPNLKNLSFGKYLENDTAMRHKFWVSLLSLPKLEEVTTVFNAADTHYYRKLKKLNVVLNLDVNFTLQFGALKNVPSLYRIEFPGTSNIPISLQTLQTVKEIDFTSVFSQDFSSVFEYIRAIPSLEKVILSNDQFTVFPAETAKLTRLKEMEIYNLQHGAFDPISEKEKKHAAKMLPNCKFTYIE